MQPLASNAEVLWQALPAWPWELVAVLGFVGLVTANRGMWRTHPVCSGAAALLLLVGLHPWLDVVARQSIWLHSLQSALVHHAAPLFLVLACDGLPKRRRTMTSHLLASPLSAWAVVLAFAGMSAFWMLPALHLRLMEDAQFYSAMKWGMALSGLLLCHVAAQRGRDPATGDATYWLFNLAVALPQAAIGGLLMASPPLYPMVCTAAVAALGLDARDDQRRGGAVLLASALLFLAAEAWRRYRIRYPGAALVAA